VNRRRFLEAAAVSAAAGGAVCAAAAIGASSPRRIEVKGSKFAFTPSEIKVRKDEAVVFVLTAEDFPHGFALPEFKVRRDFLPGKVVELPFTADKAGKFHLICDNFCGEGHDMMSGWLVVADK
jgi:cytochrome c oxidase subunit II